MLYLDAIGVKVMYGLRTVLDIDRLEIHSEDRIGLVGENGVGKTTLLKVLSGELIPDEGVIHRRKPVVMIGQLTDAPEDMLPDGRIASTFKVQAARQGLSGGEMTRRKIAFALTGGGHVLLADEPTTDLDREGVLQLEKQLLAYDGALLLVSHDRALLDNVCTEIWELEAGKLTAYPGNYEAYRQEKERKRAFERFEYEQYREEKARLQAAITGKREHAKSVTKLPKRMGNSEARLHRRSATEIEEKLHKTQKALETRLSQLEIKSAPREDPQIIMQLGAYSPIGAKIAIEAQDVTLRFGERVLLENGAFTLPTRSKTALLGANGCGKTTILRYVLEKQTGVYINPSAKVGFFGQQTSDTLVMRESILWNVMRSSVQPEGVARTVLARLGIRGDDVFKRVSLLSGGERVKTALASLFVADHNLLILDEPTNHLDIFSIEALGGVLQTYAGTLLLVSHDQRFVEQVATRLLLFENKRITPFEGTAAEYAARDKQTISRTQTELTMLDMQLAALAARMTTPQKGDDPLELSQAYSALVEQRRQLRE